jgi:hypothetical protein
LAINATASISMRAPSKRAGDLDCGRCGWIIREDLAADLGEFGIGRKVREVDLDAGAA